MKLVQRHPGYYEAILQLRPAREDVKNYFLQELSKRPGVFISKEVEHKTGIDYYLSSQDFAKSLGPKLRKRFKGTPTYSRSLYSRSRTTSKLLYRLTVLFRLEKE
ncbi:MAG TPA: NMD3-related protein [Candidatus Nanoarchaeia archaeon]|nr:NMD3-related protein [Candidatus Nanoarchaeia archaeon]